VNQQTFDIAFDMDDTLCALVGPSIELARKLFGRTLSIPRYGMYRGWFPGQLSDAEREELLTHVYREEFYLNLPPNFAPFHQTNVQLLSEIAHDNFETVKVITARAHALGNAETAENVTRAWLEKQRFKNAHSVIIHAHDHDVKKTSFCPRPTVAVEDSHHVADEFLAFDHHHVVMVDQEWNNLHPRHPQLTRTTSRHLASTLRGFHEHYSHMRQVSERTATYN